jgi:hypothetical protein
MPFIWNTNSTSEHGNKLQSVVKCRRSKKANSDQTTYHFGDSHLSYNTSYACITQDRHCAYDVA